MTETAPGEVPPLSLFGRRQLYDEAAFTAGETTTPKAELLKLCAGLRAVLDALLGKLAGGEEGAVRSAEKMELMLITLVRGRGVLVCRPLSVRPRVISPPSPTPQQHLLARLRTLEAHLRLVGCAEAAITDALEAAAELDPPQ